MENNEFYAGWKSLGYESDEWDDYSRQLSDSDRRSVEAGGYDSGVSEAQQYREWLVRNCEKERQ